MRQATRDTIRRLRGQSSTPTAGDVATPHRQVRAVSERVDQVRHDLRGMRQVGIHADEDVALRGREAVEHRAGQTELSGPAHDADRQGGGHRCGEIGGPVGRAVIDDDELPVAAGERRREALDERRKRSGFVVGGDDDGDHGLARTLRGPCGSSSTRAISRP